MSAAQQAREVPLKSKLDEVSRQAARQMTGRVLFVCDGWRSNAADSLSNDGHHVFVLREATRALALVHDQLFDVVVLDVSLRDRGIRLCRLLRENGFDGAIVVLADRSEVHDRVEALNSGADDYLVKPADDKEVLARILALLRRMGRAALIPVRKYRFGDVTVDFDRREVVRNRTRVILSSKELRLLRCLIDNRRRAISRDGLLTRIWEDQPFIGPRTVDVHIAWLRKKIEANSRTPRYIVTVRGEGYCFVP